MEPQTLPDHGLSDRSGEGGEKRSYVDRILNVLPSLVYVFNQDTQSNEYINRSVGAVLGYDTDEIRVFGPSLMAALCHPEDLPKVMAHFQDIICLGDTDVISVEYRMRHKTTGWVWFLSLDTVFDRHLDGRVRRHIGVATEITAQKQAERRAKEASDAATVANEDLRAFAYAISHDMRSPLNTLHLLLSEIRHAHSGSLDSDARQLFDHALQTVDNMQGRLESVLDYTRLIDGASPMLPVSLADIVAQVLSDLAVDIDQANAIVQVGDLPQVLGTARDLKACFHHLIANALKFRQADQAPCLEIADTTSLATGLVQISITDNGIGIPSESHDEIFDMFKRLNAERLYPGIGLGLAICRRVAISHGGGISVQSRRGDGACFTVQLRSADAVDEVGLS
ncbi:MAG: PAS domain-containing sensor histidine kinase [Pseudomonadota bacterium]